MYAIILNSRDNVATAVEPLKKGQQVVINGGKVELIINEDIPFGHKFAIKTISEGEEVIKYGEVIGVASREIRIGDHVHIHNIKGKRGTRRRSPNEIKGI